MERIAGATVVIDPVFLNTPQFVSEPLSRELGIELVVKVETVNPLCSFKGRGASLFAAQLPERVSTVVCASSGNFGQALAWVLRPRRSTVLVFIATSANPLKAERIRQFGADVRLAGADVDAAKEDARAFASDIGCRLVRRGWTGGRHCGGCRNDRVRALPVSVAS